jgi:hypothetical protein
MLRIRAGGECLPNAEYGIHSPAVFTIQARVYSEMLNEPYRTPGSAPTAYACCVSWLQLVRRKQDL